MVRLVLTLLVSTATTKRAFSTIKVVKTNLRNHWRLYMQAKVVIGPPQLAKIYIYTLAKKKLYVKLTYSDHSNKNVEHTNLRITKSWVQQK